MKLLIASDIHGSAYYCAQLIERIKAENPDRILLLGDLLYHGPRNALPTDYSCPETWDLLNAIKDKIVAVRGNCDSEVDQMVLEFPVLADYAVLCEGTTMIYCTHGHVYNTGKLPPLQKGDVLLHGHTHIPAWEDHGSYRYLNPGSVSIPKENSWHGYMVLENGLFTWKDFDGNVRHQLALN